MMKKGTKLDGSVTNATSLLVQSLAENDAEATTFVASLNLLGGAGALAKAEITDTADIEALVGKDASLTVPGGTITIEAKTQGAHNKAHADATGGSLGAIAAGVMLATVKVGGGVKSEFDGKVLDAASLTLTAIGTNASDAKTVAGALAAFGGAAAAGSAEVTDASAVEALVGKDASINVGGLVSLTATGTNNATADSDAASVGAGTFAGTKPEAKIQGRVKAGFDGKITSASGLTLNAGGTNTADATGFVAAAGAIAAAGEEVDASITANAKVEAAVGGTASITAPNADVLVKSKAENHATANANGGSLGAIDLNIMLPTAEIGGSATSSFDGKLEDVAVDAKSLTVQAETQNDAKAGSIVVGLHAIGGSGAKSDAEIKDSADAATFVGKDASIAVSDSVLLDSKSSDHAKATATGVDGGAVNVAVMFATAVSDGDTVASFDGTLLRAASLTIQTNSSDTITALFDIVAAAPCNVVSG